MPLLDDAKTCYVGTTPITTIMAGSVQVWPKGTPPPVGPFDYLTLYNGNRSDSAANGLYLSWETLNRPSTCARGTVYTVQSLDERGWYDFINWNDPRGYNWMPLEYPNVMAMFLGPSASSGALYFRLKYESAPGVYEYSIDVQDAPNIGGHPRLPTDYQQNECNGKPRP